MVAGVVASIILRTPALGKAGLRGSAPRHTIVGFSPFTVVMGI